MTGMIRGLSEKLGDEVNGARDKHAPVVEVKNGFHLLPRWLLSRDLFQE